MGQEKCPLAWRAKSWCKEDELLLPDNSCRSLKGPSIVFLWPAQAKVRIASYWTKHSKREYFLSNQYSSSFTPRLLHVADSCFPVFDPSSGDPTSAVIQATRQQLVSLCRSVVEEEENQPLCPLLTSHYLRNCSVWFRISWAHHFFLCCQSLMRCLTNSTTTHLHCVLPFLTNMKQVGKTQIGVNLGLGKGFVQSASSRWKKSNAIDELNRVFLTEPTDASN